MSHELDLPGFRFHPTEEELLNFYLRNTVSGKKSHYNIIGLTNIYRHDPWELPGLAKIGEREWYFFVPRDRKQGSSGGRPNRTTENGFWKATGSDRLIVSSSDPKRIIGLKKTLVFYKGRAPRGSKTDWVMNEYRLPDSTSLSKDIVLCKIYRKATSLKVLEQRAATMEEATRTILPCPSSSSSPPPPPPPAPSSTHFEAIFPPISVNEMVMFKEEQDQEGVAVAGERKEEEDSKRSSSTSIQLPPECEKMPELLMPGKINTDWTQDPFWTQLGSPWFLNLTPNASILNF